MRILRGFRSHDEREKNYANTLELVTFRWTRFIYLGVLLGALAILSIGVAASIITLYPKMELQARNEIKAKIEEVNQNQLKAKQLIEESAKPGFKENLTQQREIAEKKFEKAQADFNEVLEENEKTNGFRGGAITTAGDAKTVEELEQLGEVVSEAIKKCPGPNYNGFTEDQCQAFQKLVTTLIVKRTAILDAWKSLQEKIDTERNTDRVINEAELTLKGIADQLTVLNTELADASKYFSEWIPHHLSAFLLLMLQTLSLFFVYVWATTITADILSWIVMIMLSLEKKNANLIE
jgi:hypothetical protein